MTESGEFFYTSFLNGLYVEFGTMSVSGSTIAGSEQRMEATDTYGGSPYPDLYRGLQSAPGSPNAFTGSVQPRVSVTLTDSVGSAIPNYGTTTWTYSSVYSAPSSFAIIAGTWTALGPDSAVLTISSNGVLFEQDPNAGCVINGQVSLINPSYNAYDIDYTYANCGMTNENWTFMNGQHVHLFGYINGTQLILAGSPGTITITRH